MMKVLISDNLSHLFTLWKSQHSDDCLDIIEAIMSGDSTSKWQSNRTAFFLVADEIKHFKPKGNEIYDAFDSSTISVLRKALVNVAKGSVSGLNFDQHYETEVIEQALGNKELAQAFELVSKIIKSDFHEHEEYFFVSPDPILNRIRYAENKALTGDSILSTLAICGISIALPRLQARNMDVIEEIREKYEEERRAYVNEVRLFIQGCYERIKDGSYDDLYKYAEMVTNQKIQYSANAIDLAVSKSDQRLLDGIRQRSIESVSSVVPTMLDPTKSFSVEVMKKLLDILCGTWSEGNSLKKIKQANPLGSYLYSLQKV